MGMIRRPWWSEAKVGKDKKKLYLSYKKNKNKDTDYKYTSKTNSALFPGTVDVFSRSIYETEWTNVKIKMYIDWFLKPLY